MLRPESEPSAIESMSCAFAASTDGGDARERRPGPARDLTPRREFEPQRRDVDRSRRQGIEDPSGTEPPTHWLGALGPAHFVPVVNREGYAYGGIAECGERVRGAVPVFRGEGRPRCIACIARLGDGYGVLPD